MRPQILIELLERASSEPIGLWIETTNPKALMQRLINLQRELEMPDLMICMPSIETAVFIVHRSVELD